MHRSLSSPVLPSALVLLLALPLGSCQESHPDVVRFGPTVTVDPDVQRIVDQRIAAVEQDPGNARLRRSLGLAYEANSAWGEAERAYAHALQLDPDDTLARLHRAICLEEAGQLDSAFALLEQVVDDAPDLVRGRWRYGLALLERHELDAADEQFAKVAGDFSHAPHGFLGRGKVALARGDAERAAELLQEALSRSPSDGYATYALGEAYRELGRDTEAQRLLTSGQGASRPGIGDDLSQELSQYARSRSARISRATTMLQGTEVKAAENLLQELREQYPDDEAIVSNLSVALMRQMRYEEALEVIEDLERINPEQHAVYINRAGCLLDLGQLAAQDGDDRLAQERWADALTAADEAVRLAPHIATAHLKRAQVLMRLRMLDESIVEMQETLRLGHRNEDVYLNLAKLQDRQQGAAAALATLEEAREENATFVETRCNLIVRYAGQGRGQEARAVYDELVEIAPNDRRTADAQRFLAQKGM